MRVWCAVIGVGLAASLACGKPSGAPQCLVGASLACACTDGRTGAQLCLSGDTLGPCSCTGATGGAAGAGGATATSDAGPPDAAGATGAAGAPDVIDYSPIISLPIAVTRFWHPSAWYGDPYTESLFTQAGEPIAVEDETFATTGPCSMRQAFAVGRCFKVTYTPAVAPDAGAPGFGGVALVGDLPNGGGGNSTQLMLAPRVQQGATQITAAVAGALGNEPVTFWFGVRNIDSFATDVPVTLTTSWQTITAPITTPYDHILGPFGWQSASVTRVVFYFDNVVISH